MLIVAANVTCGSLAVRVTGVRNVDELVDGIVVFDPRQTRVWEDTRDGASSPWSYGWKTPSVPPEGKWVVGASFSQPGTYVLRCLAHDGGLATAEDVTVVVSP